MTTFHAFRNIKPIQNSFVSVSFVGIVLLAFLRHISIFFVKYSQLDFDQNRIYKKKKNRLIYLGDLTHFPNPQSFSNDQFKTAFQCMQMLVL